MSFPGFLVSQKNIPAMDTNQFKAADFFFFTPFYSTYSGSKVATNISE